MISGPATNLTGAELENSLDLLLSTVHRTFVESPGLGLEAAELSFPLPRRPGAGGAVDESEGTSAADAARYELEPSWWATRAGPAPVVSDSGLKTK